MNPAKIKTRRAFTLIELLVVLVIGVILVMFFLPSVNHGPRKSPRVHCMSNQKQIGIGFLMYTSDHGQFPWGISTNKGGTEELIGNGKAADHFVKLAPYRLATRLFVCPADEQRKAATTNFLGFSNSNLSYYVSLDASQTLTSTSGPVSFILTGDRHLALNNQPVKPGLLAITNNATMSWTKELHFVKNSTQTVGVMLFADGHAESVMAHRLGEKFHAQAITTNWLVIP